MRVRVRFIFHLTNSLLLEPIPRLKGPMLHARPLQLSRKKRAVLRNFLADRSPRGRAAFPGSFSPSLPA